ncbi:DUF4136 domain-containing protein [Chryseolinea lacunae]|uniref:DUF4136 domain-containing protein n=1 Tax=Chryseolinea lacunae TaxID=2801331 RepID=A0ABS1KKY5_9BACT|nr:DUF4136 domain-containing protein [Chryseolinea lacunae]MBL0740129.1 DUF4136 domain-containing protein [Chryseolinea lacunae]
MKKIALLTTLVGVALWGCQPEPDSVKLLDQLVVSTHYDKNANFKSYATYSMSTDTIGFISNANPKDTILTQKESTYPRTVLQRVEANINKANYTRVAKNASPDLGINVYVVNDYNLFQQVVYPSYYYPSYYGYYGSYYNYPYVNTYAQNTGALVLEIVDLKNIGADKKVNVLWTAYMGDVYSTIDLNKQSTDAIDQAFLQSPYISK